MPLKTAGMRHAALFVSDLDATCAFYTDLLGMEIEWQPDADNIYLTSGNDNLALIRRPPGVLSDPQRLDHIGFVIDQMDQVDEWFVHLKQAGVETLSEPKTHRDGARSFYCRDPDGTTVQLIFHPPISAGSGRT